MYKACINCGDRRRYLQRTKSSNPFWWITCVGCGHLEEELIAADTFYFADSEPLSTVSTESTAPTTTPIELDRCAVEEEDEEEDASGGFLNHYWAWLTPTPDVLK